MQSKSKTIIMNFQLTLDREEVLRFLGYQQASSRLKNWHYKALEEALREGEELIKPAAVYSILKGADIPQHKIFSGADEVALCISTCDSERLLEKRVTELFSENKATMGVFLDALGSHAAEETAKQVNLQIDKEFEEKGFTATNRFSPGYCIWTLEGQKTIFNVLDSNSIGVVLNDSLMMSPRKSVSFAVNAGSEENLDLKIGRRTCEDCSLTNCRYRRKPEE